MGLRSDIDDVREQIHREHLSLLTTDVRVTIQKAKLLLADFLLEQKFNRMMRAVKANFNPTQPRVPAGNSDGGRWTDEGSSWEGLRAQYARNGDVSDSRVLSDADPEPLISGSDYAGVGHHNVPRAVFKLEKYKFSDDVLKTFDRATTGHLNDPTTNVFDKVHRAYNKAVEEALDDFIKRNNISEGKMTSHQADKFVDEVKKSRDPRIRSLLNRILWGEVRFRMRNGVRINE